MAAWQGFRAQIALWRFLEDIRYVFHPTKSSWLGIFGSFMSLRFPFPCNSFVWELRIVRITSHLRAGQLLDLGSLVAVSAQHLPNAAPRFLGQPHPCGPDATVSRSLECQAQKAQIARISPAQAAEHQVQPQSDTFPPR